MTYIPALLLSLLVVYINTMGAKNTKQFIDGANQRRSPLMILNNFKNWKCDWETKS